jgi:hypothetical protein
MCRCGYQDLLGTGAAPFRAVPQLLWPFQASVQDGFFLSKNPLGGDGFTTQ